MQVTTGNAMSAIGKISPGYRAVGLTKGQFSLLDLVIAIIDQIGESDLTISTWTPGRNDMEQVRSMLGTAKIKNFRLLIDIFAGSGSAIVACENLSRRCRAIEISPAYCAVILERMREAFPGIEIERI